MFWFDFQFVIAYFILFVFALVLSNQQDKTHRWLSARNQNYICWVILLAFGLIFGLRRYDVGTDTKTYIYIFENVDTYEFGVEFVFKWLVEIIHLIVSTRGFLLIMALLYVIILGIVIRQNEFSRRNQVLLLLTFATFFFFKNFGFNAIRHGISAMLLLVAFNSLERRNWTSTVLLFLCSIGIHVSSVITIVFYLTARRMKSLWPSIMLYFFSAMVSLSGHGIKSLASVITGLILEDRRAAYFVLEMKYDTGFRPDFFIFNTAILLTALFVHKKVLINQKEYLVTYRKWINYFVLSSSIFFFAFDMPFSDRWGLLSWIVIPYLLEPLFNINSRYKVSTVYTLVMGALFIVFELFII